jgi:hypothetical protein
MLVGVGSRAEAPGHGRRSSSCRDLSGARIRAAGIILVVVAAAALPAQRSGLTPLLSTPAGSAHRSTGHRSPGISRCVAARPVRRGRTRRGACMGHHAACVVALLPNTRPPSIPSQCRPPRRTAATLSCRARQRQTHFGIAWPTCWHTNQRRGDHPAHSLHPLRQ